MKISGKNFFSFPISHFPSTPFFLFPFLFSLFTLLLSCTSPTETPTGSLTGTVNLEDLSDHSGITVALYDLAYLDTTIVRINAQYPQIGVKINQHTEFDHRLQSPIKSTITEIDGSFELKKIPTGIYNIVAIKDGWGFKYLYEITIAEGDNELTELTPSVISTNVEKSNSKLENSKSNNSSNFKSSILNFKLNRDSDLTLYPETHLSGNISDNIVVATDHHLVIDDDTVFVPNTSSLTIEPGAVIRINPEKDLTIHGTLTAQGEENNMFWVTSNDGFLQEEDVKYKVEGKKYKDESLNPYSLSLIPDRSEELLLYNSMELSSFASVSDDLVEWGKWDWGSESLKSTISKCVFQNIVFNNSSCGLYVSGVTNTIVAKQLSRNCGSSSLGGIVVFNSEDVVISNNILLNNYNGIYSKFCNDVIINNNYLIYNYQGFLGLTFTGDIYHNDFERNIENDIAMASSTIENEVIIELNRLKSNIGILQFTQGSFSQFGNLSAVNNNLYNKNKFLFFYTYGPMGFIDMTGNYFDGLTNELDIRERIINMNTCGNYFVIVDDFVTNEISNAGVE